MKLLLTGANGFVGKPLSQRLLAENNNIVAPLRSPDLLPIHELLQPVEISGLQDNIDWSVMLDSVDIVVHLASRVHVMNDTSNNPLAEFRKINVDATMNLARQAAAMGVKRFIYISSIKVNGEVTPPDKPFTEEDIPSPIDPYGISKAEAEQALFELATLTEIEVVVIRPVLVYGPGVKANFRSMMRWLNRGIPLPFGALHNKRSLLAVDNLLDMIITCIDHPAAVNQVFLAADGEDMSTTELLERVAAALGKRACLFPVNRKILELGLKLMGKCDIAVRLCDSLQVDISKAKSLLNWTPPSSVSEGLRKTAQDFLGS